MLLGSMKERDHLGPESHQVHERHIGQSHQQKKQYPSLACPQERRGGWGGVTRRQLATSKRWLPFPHQHRALPITSEIHFTELQVLHPMVPP